MDLSKKQREARALLGGLLKKQQTESDVAVVVNEETLTWQENGGEILIDSTAGYVSVRTGDLPIALYVHRAKLSVALSGHEEIVEVASAIKGVRVVHKGPKSTATAYAEVPSVAVRREPVRTLVRTALRRGHEQAGEK